MTSDYCLPVLLSTRPISVDARLSEDVTLESTYNFDRKPSEKVVFEAIHFNAVTRNSPASRPQHAALTGPTPLLAGSPA